MYCPNCRKKIDNNFKFCPNCAYEIPDISLLKRKSIDSVIKKIDIKRGMESIKSSCSGNKTDLKIFIIVIVITLILIIFSSLNDLQKNESDKPTVNTEVSKKELAKIEKKSAPKKAEKPYVPPYKIINVSQTRGDGSTIYYILINPVNLSNTNFKEEVKTIVKDLTQKKGGQLTAEIFDDKDALNLDIYKTYGKDITSNSYYFNNYGYDAGQYYNNVPKSKDLKRKIHYIASFQGEMGEYKYLYNNELDFFLAVESSESGGSLYRKVKEYKDETEFNPSSYISKCKSPQKHKTVKIQAKKAYKQSSNIIHHKKVQQQNKPIAKVSQKTNYINVNDVKPNKINNVDTKDLLLGE